MILTLTQHGKSTTKGEVVSKSMRSPKRSELFFFYTFDYSNPVIKRLSIMHHTSMRQAP